MAYLIALLAFGAGYCVGRETNSQQWRRQLRDGLVRENVHERRAARQTEGILNLLRMNTLP